MRRGERAPAPVSQLCRALGAARSGFYDWQRSPVSDRQIADWLLTEQIRAIFEGRDEIYGSPRVHAELLLDHGVRVSNKRVARLMRQHGGGETAAPLVWVPETKFRHPHA